MAKSTVKWRILEELEIAMKAVGKDSTIILGIITTLFLYIHITWSPPVLGFRKRSHKQPFPMSFTWASHIATSRLTGC